MVGFDVVTGAFGQTGNAIARQLLAGGRRVRTLTRAPKPAGTPVDVVRPDFSDPASLTRALEGCDTLYSAIWTRFGPYAPIVRDASVLFACARAAGVRRIVQVTVAHAQDPDAWDLPYWRGKHELEQALAASGVPHSILRPALIFGPDDTLVNNLAWFMRHLHMVPGVRDPQARIRPVAVDDVATLAIAETQRSRPSESTVDAVGPESFSYQEFLRTLCSGLGVRARFPVWPARAVWLAGTLWTPILNDTLLGWDELRALRRGLLDAPGPATAPTRFSTWAAEHGSDLGRKYRSQRRRAAGRSYTGTFG